MTLKNDPNDKRFHREVDFHANEPHDENEFDKEHDGKIADQARTSQRQTARGLL